MQKLRKQIFSKRIKTRLRIFQLKFLFLVNPIFMKYVLSFLALKSSFENFVTLTFAIFYGLDFDKRFLEKIKSSENLKGPQPGSFYYLIK